MKELKGVSFVKAGKGLTRREVLRSMCATAALAGVPMRMRGAKFLGKPDLVIGILSDIHVALPPRDPGSKSVMRFRHALEYFRDRHVDGVLVSGDLADAGLETELSAVADTWFSVFPGGRLPDGSPVANLMHYGDHDAEARFYNKNLKDKFAAAGLPVPQSMSEGENRKIFWERLFNEPWSPIRHVKVKGYDFVLSNFMREGGKSAPDDLEAQLRAMNLDSTRPFFYSQHRWMKGTYLTDEEMWGRDNGVAFKVLSKFPNAVAFQGHTHYMLTDERGVWFGDFTAINAGALRSQCVGRIRENGVDISWYKTDYMREKQMRPISSSDGHAGMVMTLKGDLVILERRDFERDASLGPDLVFSIDPKAHAMQSNEARMAASQAPEFNSDAAVGVVERAGLDRLGRETPQIEVSFPTVRAAGERPRAFDYVVRAERADGSAICEKRVYSPGINLPEEREAVSATCLFAVREIAGAERVRFSVRPCNCWGLAGKPIVSKEWRRRI